MVRKMKLKYKGLHLFGLVITTKKSLENIKIELPIDDLKKLIEKIGGDD